MTLSLASFDPDFGDVGEQTGANNNPSTVLTLEDILAARAANDAPAEAAPVRSWVSPAKVKAPVTAESLVEQARARLVELKLELEAAAKIQAEHDWLERLVAAADSIDT